MKPLSIKNKSITRLFSIIALITVVAGCTTFAVINFDELYGPAEPRNRQVTQLSDNQVDYWQDVKPVLDKRCVVCHGCYDAACQLKLTAIEGIERGAHPDKVYNPARIKAADLTRLFEDAETLPQWRDKGFFPLLNEHPESLTANQNASILYQSLVLKERHPLPAEKVLDGSFSFGIDRGQICPTPQQYQDFAQQNPLWGMPYALPGLNTNESQPIKQWIEEGARYTPRPSLDPIYQGKIDQWETFLNQDSLKSQLVSRYIFEHLFLAHLHFDDSRQFFRLVRSATPPGEAIQRIATRRPYDDHGLARVYYRLIPEYETKVVKSHMPYALNAERLARWQSLFFEEPYEVTSLPNYEITVAANPFIAFKALPVRSRYKFMLDEAQFTIMNFIKGPVCRGQVAVNVIRDHFWVFFIDPDNEKAKQLSDVYLTYTNELEMPNAKGDTLQPLTNWRRYSKKVRELGAIKDQLLADNLSGLSRLNLDFIWDGDGHNANAALTIFRHWDSASVEKGLIGQPPQTAWVIGYTLLERIHYLLVAGYDVYGNLGHQLLSRTYMDFLRLDGESNFLQFLPSESRTRERNNWYREAPEDLIEHLTLQNFEQLTEPDITYKSKNPKLELYEILAEKLGYALATEHELKWVEDIELQEQLEKLADFKGAATAVLPEVSFIEIKNETNGKSTFISLLRNNAHLNISSIFKEDKALVPEENTVTVTRGFIGSYPNAFMKVTREEINDFVEAVLALKTEADYSTVLDRFGVRRTDPNFWQQSDNIHRAYYGLSPVNFAMFDYNRLENR